MADVGRHQVVHKSGPLKQQNKAHKNGKHRTKGQIAALFKGEFAALSQGCPEQSSCPVMFQVGCRSRPGRKTRGEKLERPSGRTRLVPRTF